MSTNTTTDTVEFIVVGKDTGSAFILWDVAPAPTNLTKRTMALEEIEIDAHDAFGSVHLEHAVTATAAVNQILTDYRNQYDQDDYALHKDSNREALDAPAEAPTGPVGTASTQSATRDASFHLKASVIPGSPRFNVFGLPVDNPMNTQDRVRTGLIASGKTWPTGNVLVDLTATPSSVYDVTGAGTSGLDLAIACSILAAAGDIPAEHLAGTALIGELGLDGEVLLPHGIPGTLRALAASGTTTALVPLAAVDEAASVGIRAVGVSSLTEALGILADHHVNGGPAPF